MASRSFLRAMIFGGLLVLALWLVVIGVRLAGEEEPPRPAGPFDPSQFVRSRPKLDAPYVVTDYAVVDAMLAMADVRPNDFVIDLGSGDGRILIAAARSHGARGLGVDIDPARVREATDNARAAGVSHRVTFRQQNLFETPLGEADVVTLYLTREVNLRLRPRILAQMRPGTRLLSHDFDMGDWRADQRQRIGSSAVYMWTIPARAAGRWTLTDEGRTGTLDLRQRYQRLEGTVSAGGVTTRLEQGYVAGERIHFIANLGAGRRAFEGRVEDDRILPLRSDAEWRAARSG